MIKFCLVFYLFLINITTIEASEKKFRQQFKRNKKMFLNLKLCKQKKRFIRHICLEQYLHPQMKPYMKDAFLNWPKIDFKIDKVYICPPKELDKHFFKHSYVLCFVSAAKEVHVKGYVLFQPYKKHFRISFIK